MGRIHGVDEKIPVECIAEMTTAMAALIARWNAA
jgi:acetylornithine deacetylase/succinyl-diaminopimelate desuccinylase-like protein